MSQTLTFESAVKRLFFDVAINKATGSLVDTFMTIDDLHHNDSVIRQWNLNVSMQMNSSKEAWSSRHIFTFTKSPFTDLKIKSGYIEVTIGETLEIKKLLDVHWYVDFDNKKDGDLFFKRLKNIFEPLSTKQKTEFDKDVGHIAQYSTRKTGDNAVKDISFCLSKSLQSKKYQVSFLLMNEFMRE